MAIRKIVKLGDDVLRKECRQQEKFDLRLAILLKDMADTMYRAEGVGVVTRPNVVTVQFQDRKGNPCELTGEGFLARAICHELDHLDGRVYIDVMDRELTPEEIEGHIPEDDAE